MFWRVLKNERLKYLLTDNKQNSFSKIMKNKKIYSIIYDTNSLIFGNPFRGDVMNMMTKYSKNKQVDLNFYIPKVVAEEIISKMPKQIKQAIDSYYKSIKEINGLMSKQINEIKLGYSEDEVKEATQKIFETYNIKVLDTPSLGLNKFINDAIYHIPPFSINGDSGFKDSVICETIKTHAPGLSNSSKVVVVSSDAKFKNHLVSISDEYLFKVYSSVQEFESELKLSLLLSGDQKQLESSLSSEADKIFFKEDDKSTLFYKEGLDEINRSFPTLFSNPQPSSDYLGTYNYTNNFQWVPIDKASYDIFKPLFIEKDNTNFLIWESTVVYSQNFKNATYGGVTIVGHSNYLSTPYTYKLKFRIKWKIRIDIEGRLDFRSAKILDVQHEDNHSEYLAMNTDLYNESISLPTAISGTVTASEVTK